MPILDIPVVAEATPMNTPTPTASSTLSPTPTTSGTPSPTPTDTPTPTPTNTQVSSVVSLSCANEPQGEFRRLWEKYKERLGCPHQIQPIGGFYAEQPFERGHMFWSKDGRLYLATIGHESGSWQIFTEDSSPWKEGMPQASCDVQVPPGLVQPIRGFGGLWCAHQGLREQIGWGLDVEKGFEAGTDLIQGFEGGLIFRDSDGQARGAAYVLFSDDMTFIKDAY
jgi:hypothetical protein